MILIRILSNVWWLPKNPGKWYRVIPCQLFQFAGSLCADRPRFSYTADRISTWICFMLSLSKSETVVHTGLWLVHREWLYVQLWNKASLWNKIKASCFSSVLREILVSVWLTGEDNIWLDMLKWLVLSSMLIMLTARSIICICRGSQEVMISVCSYDLLVRRVDHTTFWYFVKVGKEPLYIESVDWCSTGLLTL